MTQLALLFVALPIALFIYSYFAYPALLWLVARMRPAVVPAGEPAEWPSISITIPAYNEEASIGDTIESILSIPYRLSGGRC